MNRHARSGSVSSLLPALGLALSLSATASATVIFVPGDAATLAAAHTIAVNGDEVVVTAASVDSGVMNWTKQVNIRGQSPGGIHTIQQTGSISFSATAGVQISDLKFVLSPTGGIQVNNGKATFSRVEIRMAATFPRVALRDNIGGTDLLNSAVIVSGSAVSIFADAPSVGGGGRGRIIGCTIVSDGYTLRLESQGSRFDIRNSIFHTPGAAPSIDIENTNPGDFDFRYCLVDGGMIGIGNINADPELDLVTLALSPTSPCIDTGSINEGVGGADLRAEPRFWSTLPGSQLPHPDMGAVERQRLECPGDNNGDGMINGSDLSVLLSTFGQACQ